jgi:hypothetical protein
MIRQNVLLSNANKSNVYNLNNDINLTFPTNLFFKAPQYIELLNLDLNAEINLFGNTNNSFYIEYKNVKHLIIVEYSTALKTDYQLTQAIKQALNNPRDPTNPVLYLPYTDNDLILDITESSIENIVTNYKIERESFTSAYTLTSNSKICIIDFGHKESIGPIIGFGNGKYTLNSSNNYSAGGTSTQSISAYNYIDVINSSGSTPINEPSGPFPNYSDVNCKMVLYDSNKRIIPNKFKENDTTISLNFSIGLKQYENIGEVLDLIEDQLNEYSSYFSPAATFVVSYDNITKKITLKNTTGAKFGIGFDFNNITRDRAMYSTNGINWYPSSTVNNHDWRSAAYARISNNDIIVAVSSTGDKNRIMRSINSTTSWTSIDSPYDNIWSSGAYHQISNDPLSSQQYIYVLVASRGITKRVIASYDGITWTYQNSPMNDWTYVIHDGPIGQEKFVAVASSGTGNRVMTSLDGLSWISRTSAADNNWTSLTWGGLSGQEKFVAVASSGTGNRVMTSPDGITWTLRTSAADNNWTSITWGGLSGQEKFVAVASSGTGNRVMTSPDGITWTLRTSAVDNNWTSITWGGLSGQEKFVAVASSGTGNRIMTSLDGITWTLQTSPADYNWNSVIWSSFLNKFIAISSNGNNYIMISDNGINWTLLTISFNYEWNQIFSGHNFLLGIGVTLGKSSDIYKWNNIKFLVDNYWTSVCRGGLIGQEKFVAVASSGIGNRIMTSITGEQWIIQYNPVDNNWTSICWGGVSGQEKFVAVASSGTGDRIMTSSDAITWTIRVSPADNNWTSVCWSSDINLFVAVASSGTGNRVMTSSDGITWTLRTSAANNNWTSVCWGGQAGQKKFVAVASSGTGNRIMTSVDGITWTIRVSPTDNNWTSVVWTGINKFIAVAASGITNRIMTSTNGIDWSETISGVVQSPLNSPVNIDWRCVIWVSGDLNTIVSVGTGFGNTSGSLHYILGFEQNSYFDLTDIVSLYEPLIYDQIFADDYVLICSNIVNNATDLNVIGIGNADNIKSNNIIFAIPLSQCKHFKPVDSSYYRINIGASSFSLGYKNKKFTDTNPNLVNIYLRLLSGRHITSTSQYTMQLSFLF